VISIMNLQSPCQNRSSFAFKCACRTPQRGKAFRNGHVLRAEGDSTRRETISAAMAATVLAFGAPFTNAEAALAVEGDARQQLLSAIAAKKGDDNVIPALRELAKSNPTSKPNKGDVLFGKWKLLWASDNSEVSIATRRLPLNAQSVQLVGQKGGVEEGRAANLIQLFGGAVTVKLSSAAVPDKESDDIILIGPPFYLELKLGGFNVPIQNTQKEGERKSLLGAEQNYYKQLYVENTGKPGDLRISEVSLGDPAAKGSIFVHERM